jgi:hypothetical protein
MPKCFGIIQMRFPPHQPSHGSGSSVFRNKLLNLHNIFFCYAQYHSCHALHIWVGKLFKCLCPVHCFLSESKFLTSHEVSVIILPTLIRIWCACPLLWNFTISIKPVIIKGKRHNHTSQSIISEWWKLQLWNDCTLSTPTRSVFFLFWS